MHRLSTTLLLALAAEGAMAATYAKPGTGSLPSPASAVYTWATWGTKTNDGLADGTVGAIPYTLNVGPPVGDQTNGGYKISSIGGPNNLFANQAWYGPNAPASTK